MKSSKKESNVRVYRKGVDVTPKKKKKKMPTWGKALIIIGAVILALAITVCCLYFYYFGNLKTVSINTSNLSAAEEIDEDVINIALFGVDSRTSEISGRSDAVMILSLDMKHQKLKFTSILRDSRVQIEGHGWDKLAHAYAYGGAELAVKTLNQNFNMDITRYATINFSGMEKLVNAVGGVKITVTASEATQISGISGAGTYELTGKQALAYSRIRKIDSDSVRAQRQQKVLIAMFEKIKTKSKLEYPEMIRNILPLMETSLNDFDCIDLGTKLMSIDAEIVQNEIPAKEDEAKGGIVDGVWYWQYDIDAAAERLHEIIYETKADEEAAASSAETSTSAESN